MYIYFFSLFFQSKEKSLKKKKRFSLLITNLNGKSLLHNLHHTLLLFNLNHQNKILIT